jgi:two-component system, cell cycle sensor histidine kinase and response regulator CckA
VEPTPAVLNAELETILVVDDDETVLTLVVTILEQAHFQVLSAHSGAECVTVANRTNGTIHMLLSDVDMPQMSGFALSDALRATRPEMRVMLMSGGDNGLLVLNYGWAYLQKPFMAVKLLQMVADVLHTPDRSQSGGREFDTRKESDEKA